MSMSDTSSSRHRHLLAFMADIDAQPPWRSNANIAHAYYEGDQLPQAVMEKLRERGQPETLHNLIAPAVDGVLGMEAKTRTDLMVTADEPDDQIEALAEGLNSLFADAARLGRLDKARSEAYAGQIKCGIGLVEVYRNPNPLGARYKIKYVPRDEVYWDWLSTECDWSDCRWIMRQRWIDVDDLMSLLPSKAPIIKHAINGWEGFIETDLVEGIEPDLMSAWEEYQGWSRSHTEYLSQDRQRIRLQIIYRRHIERAPILRLPSGRRIVFSKNNPIHKSALALGKAQLESGQISHIKEYWYAGPHFLGSRPSHAPQGMFPIVPFFGYRKDGSGEPYGLISRAIPAQNEVNLRRIKLTWLLQAKRVIMDEDATNMSRVQVLEEVEKPDGLITLNSDRRHRKSLSDTFQVEQDFAVASQQFQVMQESMKLIQDTMGIYSAFLGQEGAAESGVAIANLVEQGATTLAEINDNYRFGCQLVGELLLGYLIEDLKGVRNHRVVINRDDKHKRKTVIINEETPEGLSNDISWLRSHVALAPIQQTTAYKAQLADRMMKLTAQLPPDVQAAVIDLVAELSDIPNKSEFMERVRGALNVPKAEQDMTPDERAQFLADQVARQAQLDLQMREMKANVDKLEAEALKTRATAGRETMSTQSQHYANAKTQAETAKLLKEIDKLSQDIALLQQQFSEHLQRQIDDIALS